MIQLDYTRAHQCFHWPHCEKPNYQTDGASGFDLHACWAHDWGQDKHTRRYAGDDWTYMVIPAQSQLSGMPESRLLIPTGLITDIPDGYEIQIRPRSGLTKQGIHIPFGTVDSDYYGELLVPVWNLSREDFQLDIGTRIAQAVLAPVPKVQIQEIGTIEMKRRAQGSRRGTDGFGSTGR